ncbi:MAG: response regulator transcription factor [Bacteroidota bacterium]
MLKSALHILLADDHPIMLNGLKLELERIGYTQLTLAKDGEEAFANLYEKKIDLAILDIEMPKMDGFEIAEQCQKMHVDVPIILLSYHKEKSYLAMARKLGVKGYMLKEDNVQKLDMCIHDVLMNQEHYSASLNAADQEASVQELASLLQLTKSEKIILKHIAKNLSSAQIAEQLKLSKRTVEKHRSNIIQKLSFDIENINLKTWALENQKLILNI